MDELMELIKCVQPDIHWHFAEVRVRTILMRASHTDIQIVESDEMTWQDAQSVAQSVSALGPVAGHVLGARFVGREIYDPEDGTTRMGHWTVQVRFGRWEPAWFIQAG